MELDLSKVKTVFFIGIGGIGISALAQMMLARGVEVAGVNDEEGKTIELLGKLGIKIYLVSDLKKLPEADAYIYSDAWLYRGPEIIEGAKKTGKPVLSFFEALGEIAKNYKVVAVAGTHGKTTTTAMVAEIMVDAELDPTVVVGSFTKKFGSNFREGKGEYLVVEADEYNRHFLNFHPFVAVITNIEADHLDYYKDLADIQNAFEKFGSQSKKLISDYSKYIEKVPKLLVPGEHNRQNAAAALAVADALSINLEKAQKTLEQFQGTWRRLEKRAELPNGLIIYDDYAHHPTEIRASLAALRELYSKKNIVVVFQPHLYSRTRALFKEFSQAFFGASRVYVLPIYYAREAKDESISSEVLAEAIDLNGITAYGFADFQSAEEVIEALGLGAQDVLVTMGAGEAYKVADKVFNI